MSDARSDEPRDSSKPEAEDPDYDRLREFQRVRHEERVATGLLAGGSSLETIGGLVAVVLAVIGLAYQHVQLGAIATIAIGVGLLAEGASVAARWRETARKLEGVRSELASGVSIEVFGGLIGIVLGMLALIGVGSLVLLAGAAIAYGGTILLGGSAQRELVQLAPERDPGYARVTYSAIRASSGVMALVGVAAALLGILALLHVGPMLTLALLAMLGIGAAMLFAGGALTARFVRGFA